MTGNEPVRVGLIGCGSVATNMHLNGWTRFPEKALLVAVFDVDMGRATRMSAMIEGAYQARAYEHHRMAARMAYDRRDPRLEADHVRRAEAAGQAAHGPRIYTDLDRFLDHAGLEAVIVATPHHLHAPLSTTALQAGKHVFSEGPMAVNLAQADAVLDAQRRSGKVYTAQYYSRYFRGARQARRLVEAGKLGRILMARGDALWFRTQAYYDRDRWRGTRAAGDRVFLHHGRYAMDLYLWVLDDPLEEVYAYAATKTHRIEVEDNAAVQLRFQSGAYGQMLLSTSAHPTAGRNDDVERIELLGEQASLTGVLNYTTEDCEITIGSRDDTYARAVRQWIDDEPAMPADGATTHYEAFIDAVRGGPPLLTAPESTRRQVELARAISWSLAEQRPVSLPLHPSSPYYGPVPGYDD